MTLNAQSVNDSKFTCTDKSLWMTGCMSGPKFSRYTFREGRFNNAHALGKIPNLSTATHCIGKSRYLD